LGHSQMSRELSIILPCLNGFHITLDCLRWINKNTDCDYEVILIDDGSTDKIKTIEHGAIDKIAEHPCTIIRHPNNLGFAASCNDGINIARGEYVAIFNNDMFATKDWFPKLKVMLSDDKIWQASGTVVLVKEDDLETMVDYPEISVVYDGGWALAAGCISIYHEWSNTLPPSGKPLFEGWPQYSGAPWLYRKETFKELGLFDERFYPATWEDADIHHRINLAGHILSMSCDTFIYHIGSYTQDNTLRDTMGSNYKGDNAVLFFDKWNIEDNESVAKWREQ
jgi:GT2 family glycosyltransferase